MQTWGKLERVGETPLEDSELTLGFLGWGELRLGVEGRVGQRDQSLYGVRNFGVPVSKKLWWSGRDWDSGERVQTYQGHLRVYCLEKIPSRLSPLVGYLDSGRSQTWWGVSNRGWKKKNKGGRESTCLCSNQEYDIM